MPSAAVANRINSLRIFAINDVSSCCALFLFFFADTLQTDNFKVDPEADDISRVFHLDTIPLVRLFLCGCRDSNLEGSLQHREQLHGDCSNEVT